MDVARGKWTLLAALVLHIAGAAAQSAVSDATSTDSAAQPDGSACGALTITQSSTPAIVPGSSISCSTASAHFDSSYYRAFDLAALGAPAGAELCEVRFGVEHATSGSGSQPVDVKLYTTTQPFPSGFPASLSQIGAASTLVPDGDGSIVSVPVAASVPAGAQLVIEVATPDGSAQSNRLVFGANGYPETGPSYFRAAACNVASPVTMASIGYPDTHLVLYAIGQQAPELIFANGFDGPRTYAPALVKAFLPTSITTSETSQLTLTLDNMANAVPAMLTAALVDHFPAGLVVASPTDAATTCVSGSVLATAGGDTLTLGSGAQIPAHSTCTVSVAVTSATAANYSNTIAAGSLQTNLGVNAGVAAANLDVTSPPLCTPAQLFVDPGFETTDPNTLVNPAWPGTSTQFGTPICSVGICGTGGSGPRAGAYWAFFGGAGGNAEDSSVEQTVTIPAGDPRYLHFYLRINLLGGVGANLVVSVDGTPVATYPEPATAESQYTRRTVDLNAYANGASHTVRFQYHTPAGPSSNFHLDDVTLECAP